MELPLAGHEPTLVMSWMKMDMMVNGTGISSPTTMPTGNGMTAPASRSKASMIMPPTIRLVTGRLSHPFQSTASTFDMGSWDETYAAYLDARKRFNDLKLI